MAHLLTLNAGSSSIKFGLYAIAGAPSMMALGQFEGLGVQPHMEAANADGEPLLDKHWPGGAGPATHGAALQALLDWLGEAVPDADVVACGHRVVHGGPRFSAPVVVDDEIFMALQGYASLAPLHQPHNLSGIEAARAAFPGASQVACFDTAFHHAHPWVNDIYAIPRRFYDKGVRRYGFHGLSYEYITHHLREHHPALAKGKVIIGHLGSGASMCAVANGEPIASTLGFSALDGLPMGTRPGQLDPGVVLYLLQAEGMDAKDIETLFYKESGLKGLSGISNDMRELEASGAPGARQAIEYFVHRVRREVGGLTATMGGLDGLVFTGGIGENSRNVRKLVCAGMDYFGLSVDDAKNESNAEDISGADSRCPVLVVKTNEEAMIAAHTARLVA
ncbi:MAG: acetate/propionate family kinase [Pseudomonadota bacterium]